MTEDVKTLIVMQKIVEPWLWEVDGDLDNQKKAGWQNYWQALTIYVIQIHGMVSASWSLSGEGGGEKAYGKEIYWHPLIPRSPSAEYLS